MCPYVQMSMYPGVWVFRCPGVHLSMCPSAQVSMFPYVQMSMCPYVHVSRCPYVQVSICPDVQVSMCPSPPVSMCPGVRTSMCPGKHHMAQPTAITVNFYGYLLCYVDLKNKYLLCVFLILEDWCQLLLLLDCPKPAKIPTMNPLLPKTPNSSSTICRALQRAPYSIATPGWGEEGVWEVL